MRIQLVGADGHVQHDPLVGGKPDVAPEEIGVHVIVLLEGERDRTVVPIEGYRRRREVVELMPVIRRRDERDQPLLPREQARRQPREAEHRVKGEEGEGSVDRGRLRLEGHRLAVHASVHGGRTGTARRLVHEDGAGIALEGVEGGPAERARHSPAAPVGEVSLGHIVGVEVDQPPMPGRQHVARAVPAQRAPGPPAPPSCGRGVLGEVRGEARLLGEVHVATPAAGGEGEHRGEQKRRDTLDHVPMITSAAGIRHDVVLVGGGHAHVQVLRALGHGAGARRRASPW